MVLKKKIVFSLIRWVAWTISVPCENKIVRYWPLALRQNESSWEQVCTLLNAFFLAVLHDNTLRWFFLGWWPWRSHGPYWMTILLLLDRVQLPRLIFFFRVGDRDEVMDLILLLGRVQPPTEPIRSTISPQKKKRSTISPLTEPGNISPQGPGVYDDTFISYFAKENLFFLRVEGKSILK